MLLSQVSQKLTQVMCIYQTFSLQYFNFLIGFTDQNPIISRGRGCNEILVCAAWQFLENANDLSNLKYQDS